MQIKVLYPDLGIVNGRPRHPQSQGSVERANGELKKLLGVWMRTHKSKKWSLGIKFVQYQYNIGFNRNLGMSPFKAKFGNDPQTGLAQTCIPSAKWTELHNEEELNTCLESN